MAHIDDNKVHTYEYKIQSHRSSISLKFIASYVSHVALHQLLYCIYMYIDINAYVVYMYKLISLQSFNTQLFLQVEIEFERRPVQKQEEKLNEVKN